MGLQILMKEYNLEREELDQIKELATYLFEG